MGIRLEPMGRRETVFMVKYPLATRHFTQTADPGKHFLHLPSRPDMHSTDTRYHLLLDWLRTDLGCTVDALLPASADASFRRYFRIHLGDQTGIVMDAPPPRENVRPFVAVAELLRKAGVRTPEVRAVDAQRGFVLLSDFGDRSYLDALRDDSVDTLYGAALETLWTLQRGVPADAGLPGYDARLLRTELDIFREWFLGARLGLELSAEESARLEDAWRTLVDSALEQPRVCVHRDFHSRNLMVIESDQPGVLDFQDAVMGPITYDLASLLRDCYVAWPKERVRGWMEAYRDRLRAGGLLEARQAERFRRWFDLMGMQRHLKAVGIFSRLHGRDGKPGYLKDIPRTLGYVAEVGADYPELAPFMRFLERRVWPRMAGAAPS